MEKAKQGEFEKLQREEKEYNAAIKRIDAEERKHREQTEKDKQEDDVEITEKKRQVNETEVDSKLHLQFFERKILGDQSCKDRQYQKTEFKLRQDIDRLQKQIKTEELVNQTISRHIKERQAEVQKLTKLRTAQSEQEQQALEKEKAEVTLRRQEAEEEYQKTRQNIADDDEWRAQLQKREDDKEAQEEEKVKEKMSMDEAARFI